MFAFLLASLMTLAPTPTTPAPAWRTPFENDPASNTTATHAECIAYYQKLASAYPKLLHMAEAGPTDSGLPLHEVVLASDGDTDPASTRRKNRRVLFIQNGIHPGEPEGIDASMMLARDLVQQPKLHKLLEGVTVVIVPVYNVDGMLNRNSTTRVNQNGPAAYGFRGNARHLDLNRDYIKQDSRNARSFAALFQKWQPDIFVETHTSNGADYQYTMTLIATQHSKLAPALGTYLQGQLLPALYKSMEQKKWPMTPYVDFEGKTPESGLQAFLETPRYSTGYAALFNTIGFMPETHMLKAFAPRVHATYDFLKIMLETVGQQSAAIATARAAATASMATQTTFPLAWTLDESQHETVQFRGYEGRTKPSEVSGHTRLYYDRAAPFTRPVKYFNTYKPTATAARPTAYIIPQAWGEVLDILRRNGATLEPLASDLTAPVEVYYLEDYKTSPRAYEGHYLHSQVQLRPTTETVTFHKGDFVCYLTDAAPVRYLIETLEPQATDSFFAWGFFDSILQQKEHFSDYVFEDVAADLLRRDPALKQRLETLKQQNPAFASNGAAQLEWVYLNSPHREAGFNRYPVARWLGTGRLDQ
ncbi:M14 family metallopeptidase [Hymenobacter sp. BT770]|uniref:M14 family metallopeptidase n=1 Tax=Hymenobacter sp. BT770 TaxID=2886942 RepID=UPI001D1150EB|nr:M14 family metallopeptidase [Hymenobacter sp. BT770]MCC3152489.1 M14 family metallopeptidase [Hymenobacter sp. BT770]MDO3414535.1 M14 family metallopeptidase [Hymenobacter sp. BT770]